MRVTQMSTVSKGDMRQSRITTENSRARLPLNGGFNIGKIISDFEKDDYILAGLIIVLVLEGCDDYILLAALGYLFLMGFRE